MKWLLLRGLAREQRHWGEFPSIFEQVVPDATTYFLDHPGAGTEIHRASPLSVEAVAADLRERWLAMKGATNEPWGLLAISFGGMVAQQWAGDHPEDFERVVLINTSAANLSVPWKRLDYRQIPGVISALLERDREKRENKILRMTTRLNPDLKRIASEWSSYQVDRPIPRSTALRQLFAATRFKAPTKISTNLLLVSGGGDPFTDPSCPQRLSDHYQAPLVKHPNAGHDMSVDAPKWLAEQVRDWIARA